jgi:hypothetical protein
LVNLKKKKRDMSGSKVLKGGSAGKGISARKEKKSSNDDPKAAEPEVAAKGTTPVSAEKSDKKKKRKSAEGVSAAAESIPKIQKFGNSDTEIEDEKKTQDFAKSEGSDNESLETGSNQSSKAPIGDEFEIAFDPDLFGLPEDATAADVRAEIAKSKAALANQTEQTQRIAQLEASLMVAAGNPPALTTQQTTIVSDMSNYHVTIDRVNAVGFARLREKCESKLRAKRTLDRNLLISTDAQKLFGQMLSAKRVLEFAQ